MGQSLGEIARAGGGEEGPEGQKTDVTTERAPARDGFRKQTVCVKGKGDGIVPMGLLCPEPAGHREAEL